MKVFVMRLCRSHKRQLYLVSFATALLCFIFTYLVLFRAPLKDYPDQSTAYELVQKRFREMFPQEKGAGCEMPKLDPFSKAVMKYDKDVDPIVCSGEDWVQCYLSECFVTENILKQMKNLACVYTDIIYVNDDEYYPGEPTKVFGNGRYVLNRSDHVKVSCKGTDVNGFSLLSSRWFGYKAGYRPVAHAVTPPADSPNVLIVLLDSTSRNHFIRRMPKSYKVLTEELKAVVMKSHNIVGEATAGVLWPMFTGRDELEVLDSRRMPNNTRRVDIKPFIFHLLGERGYRTAYYEDMPWISTFACRFNGFAQSPTDHYLRALYQEEFYSHPMKLWTSPEIRHCFGAMSQLYFMLNYTRQLFELDGKKFCVSFSATHSHNDINNLSMVDDDMVKSLRSFRDDGILEDTVLFVMGDHGPRFAENRNCYQGKIEERLPFLSIVLPEKLKRERPDALKNLMANSEVLTTPFDVHTTVLDVLGLKDHRNKHKVPGADLERGFSFLDQIPKSRSCAEAGIMPHWCACAKWHNVSSSERTYQRAAAALADHINSITQVKRNKCAEREMVSIEWVFRHSPSANMLGFNYGAQVDRYIGKYAESRHVRAAQEYYHVKITMSPGGAIFEGSMQYFVKDDLFVVSDRDISRINAYGEEPSCISRTHPHLNKYCYCTDT